MMIARRALLAGLPSALMSLSRFSVAAELQQFPTSELTIVSTTGPHRFKVEVAETPEQMTQGLMFRRSLAPDAGMLFDYKEPTAATMWMRNTLIPLDMVFIQSDGRIRRIEQNTKPGSLRPISSNGSVRAVLEMRAGTSKKYGIAPGDRIIHPLFPQ